MKHAAGGEGGAPPPPLPHGWRLEVHEALPSTSSLLRARAEAGEADRLAVMARRQTAGRGRDGRHWESPEGNLYLSVLIRPDGALLLPGQWGLLAGVALAEAARARDPEPEALRLKWPNDLLRHGAKLAGILAEGGLLPGRPPRLDWLVLGIGVNIGTAPTLPDRPTTTLAVEEPPEAFAARLLHRLAHWQEVQARQGFGPVRAAWEALGPGRGEPLSVRLSGARLEGRHAGLAEDGGLLLDTEGGRRHILAGEVLGPATGAGGALRTG